MTIQAREHVPALTAVLSLVSLALVFGAAMGRIPSTALPHAPDAVLAAIPTVNAVLSAVALAVIATGWRAIRRGDVARHRRSMLAGLGLFATFLVLYLYRLVVEGTTSFGGPATIEQFVYLPVLVVHMSLAVVCIPLLYYVFLLAVTRPLNELAETMHPRLGRVAASLWLVSFALGIVVYLLLYVVY
jgi:putative membrane protein